MQKEWVSYLEGDGGSNCDLCGRTNVHLAEFGSVQGATLSDSFYCEACLRRGLKVLEGKKDET